MNTTIITIGDEILIGQIIDSNSAWIGQQLNSIGIKVYEILSVSDHATHIADALQRALQVGWGLQKTTLPKKHWPIFGVYRSNIGPTCGSPSRLFWTNAALRHSIRPK